MCMGKVQRAGPSPDKPRGITPGEREDLKGLCGTSAGVW